MSTDQIVRVVDPTPAGLVRAAEAHPDSWIAWYDRRLEPFLADPESWPGLAKHRLEILHVGRLQGTDVPARSLGFVDFDAPGLLPGPANRRFGTPLISPAAGLIHAAALRALAPDPKSKNLQAFLIDVGLRGIQHGLDPSSEPALLREPVPAEVWESMKPALAEADLARIVRRRYGRLWVGFHAMARLLCDDRIPILAMFRGWMASAPGTVDAPALAALHPVPEEERGDATVDVLIPTLGRPGPLRDVLDDLAGETLVPRRVIVIDQGGTAEPSGEWPFELVFLTQAEPGACRARNAGLLEVRSEWVLLLDDDVRLRPGLISYLVRTARAYGVEAVSSAVHLPGESPAGGLPRVWPVFASGASLVSARAMEKAGGFDENLEGGYGEDYEFGLRLRLTGTEVLYAPGEPVLHLKAPAGGFRERTSSLPWSGEPVPPRPAPPVLYSRRKHHTKSMQNGYRLYYSLKRLSRAPFYAWLRELRDTAKQWERSVWWADRLGDLHGPEEEREP